MRINVEQARKRAKDRVRDGSAPTLAHAQLAVARELGYASWPKLVHALERPTAAQVVAAAYDMPDRARALLERAPDLRGDPWVALTLGELPDGLEATAPGGPLDAPPLHYLARTRLAADTATPARALLARGTDPNGVWEGGWTVLAVAASRGDAPLVELLLDAGANPNDNESLYHSLEAPDAACTALLLERGAEPRGTNALPHALDFEALEPVRLLLDHGADPNEGSEGTAVHHAVKRGRGTDVIRLLVERGADLARRDAAGRTAYAHAVMGNRDDIAALLAELGSPIDLAPRDEAVAALLRGERVEQMPQLDQAARELVVTGRLTDEALDAVVASCGVGLRGWGGGTLLHGAAWHGDPGQVERLLAAGGDPRDRARTEFDTPLGWAAHGSRWAPPGGDHLRAAELLVAAGATVEPRHAELAASPLAEWLEERTLPA
jgi:ankyrin repeat protein